MLSILCTTAFHAAEWRRHWLWLVVLFCASAFAAPPPQAPADDRERRELRSFLRETVAEADSFSDRFDAEVWLMDMAGRLAPFVEDPRQRLRLLKVVHREARLAGLKPDLVLALIEVESRFDRFAVSRAGAQGLMQVMPFWKEEIGRSDDNLTDIQTNLRYGCRILQFYIEKADGNWTEALARYNGSYGELWYPERVMNAWKQRWYAGDL